MYTTRPLFSRRGVAEYRQTIKGRLKHWRKLCNLSQVQAAKAGRGCPLHVADVGRFSAGRAAGRGRAGGRCGRCAH